ncbi:hypothetical protein SKAU_G00192540 [Synaphobranchus kaupii]|uniref:Uncharacterized protein n=1 Tax=Synaphobranchus kaupii TaxID=118154 RepID=A0A9Q1FDP5_SYNKA|nr:hypothetical protein SKAU_G00192540 [Synaphobranchus kaupii]
MQNGPELSRTPSLAYWLRDVMDEHVGVGLSPFFHLQPLIYHPVVLLIPHRAASSSLRIAQEPLLPRAKEEGVTRRRHNAWVLACLSTSGRWWIWINVHMPRSASVIMNCRDPMPHTRPDEIRLSLPGCTGTQ